MDNVIWGLLILIGDDRTLVWMREKLDLLRIMVENKGINIRKIYEEKKDNNNENKGRKCKKKALWGSRKISMKRH